MLSKKEIDDVSNQIVNKLIAYGRLELSLKNIWKTEIMEWLILHPKYGLTVHSRFTPEINVEGGIGALFERLENIMNYVNAPKLPIKEKSFKDVFDALTYSEKCECIVSWGVYCKKGPPLPEAAVAWYKEQNTETKEMIKRQVMPEKEGTC